MRKPGFLHKLRDEGRLGLVAPSEEISASYMMKADDSLKSAKVLLQNDLMENSIPMSYYAMYNSLLSLLFKVGIKSENHAGTIIVFKDLFDRQDLADAISSAKEERIDTQYYVVSRGKASPVGESAKELAANAESFVIQVKIIAGRINSEDIDRIRRGFKGLF